MRRGDFHQHRPPTSRRGSLFHYYLMYMLLTSVLMTAAGLSLHALLKADRLDARSSGHLIALLRLEELLRADAESGPVEDCESKTLTLTTPFGTRVSWVIDGNLIHRETSDGQKLQSSDRFVFRKGTSLAFRREDAGEYAVLSLQDPDLLTGPVSQEPETDNEGASGSPRRKVVEILFALSGDTTKQAAGPAGEGL